MGTIPFWDSFTTGYDAPLYSPDPVDHVRLAGELLPGTAAVKGEASQRIDVQSANGRDGGNLVERGYKPGRFDIDVKISSPEQWDKWQEILPKFWRPSGKLDVNDSKKKAGATAAEVSMTEKAAVSISNWATDSLGIGACLVESVSLPMDGPSYGEKIITLKCIQYVSAPASKASATRVSKGVKSPPRAEALRTTVAKPAKPSAREGSPAAPLTPTKGGA